MQNADLRLTNASFTGNSSGWNGGAIMQWNGDTTLKVTTGETSLFMGNRDDRGANSFYFLADWPGETTTLAVTVEADAVLDMRDPLYGAAGRYDDAGAIAITKTGDGAWNLGGASLFTNASGGATTFTVAGGVLRFYHEDEAANGDSRVAAGAIHLQGEGSAFVLNGSDLTLGGGNAVTVTADAVDPRASASLPTGSITLVNNPTLAFDLSRGDPEGKEELLFFKAAEFSIEDSITIDVQTLGHQGEYILVLKENLTGDDFQLDANVIDGLTIRGTDIAKTRVGGDMTLGVTADRIVLNITGAGNQVVTWDGGTDTWNQETAIWLNSEGITTKFLTGDAVNFTGASWGDVDIESPGVVVAGMYVSGDQNYSLSGGAVTADSAATTLTGEAASGKLVLGKVAEASGDGTALRDAAFTGTLDLTGIAGANAFHGGVDLFSGTLRVAAPEQIGTSLDGLAFLGAAAARPMLAVAGSVIADGAGGDAERLTIEAGKYGGMTLEDGSSMTFRNSAAAGGDGGALLVDAGADFLMESGSGAGYLFEHNRSGGDGGAVMNRGTLSIENFDFTGNRAGRGLREARGGAIANAGALTLVVNGYSEFRGNLDDFGPNSLFLDAAAGDSSTVIDTAAPDAALAMLDPFYGLADGGNRILVVKKGEGVWQLAGESVVDAGAGTATVTVEEGTLHLLGADETAGFAGDGVLRLTGADAAFILGDGVKTATLVAGGDNTLTAEGGVTFKNDSSVRGGVGRNGSARFTFSDAVLEGTVSFAAGDSDILVLRGTVRGDGDSVFQKTAPGEVLVTTTGNVVGELRVDQGILGLVAGEAPNFAADSVVFGADTVLDVRGFTGSALGDSVTLVTSGSVIAGDFGFTLIGGETSLDFIQADVRKANADHDVVAAIGLAWYNRHQTGGVYDQAHGTFTLAAAESSFELGTVLADREGEFSDWDGASLTKAGFGTLTLTGENTYSGDTVIRGGVLAVTTLSGTGANRADSRVEMARLGTLVLDIDAAGSGDYRKTLAGYGTLVKEGAGSVTLTADNSGFSGPVDVAAGVLAASREEALGSGGVRLAGGLRLAFDGAFANAVDGSGILDSVGDILFAGDHSRHNGVTRVGPGITTLGTDFVSGADFTVNAGGALAGSGRIGGLALLGASAVGPGAFANLEVMGDLFFATGSTYAVTLDPASFASTRITAYGDVRIEEGARLLIALGGGAGHRAGDEERYQIIAADSFADATVFEFGNRIGVSLEQLILAGGDVQDPGLYLVATWKNPEFAALMGDHGTPNARRAAGAMDALYDLGAATGLGDLYDALANLPADDPLPVAAAFNQLHGEVFASGRMAVLGLRRNFQDRARSGRDLTARALAACRPDGSGPAPYTLWASAGGSWLDRRSIDRYSRHKVNASGFALGLDRLFRDNYFLGLAFGYHDARVKFSDIPSRDDMDVFHSLLYGGYRSGTWQVDAYAGYSRSWHETVRRIGVGVPGLAFDRTARAKYHDDMVSAGFEVARSFVFCPAVLTPSVGLHYSGLFSPSVREGGGDEANLRTASGYSHSLRLPAGFRLGREFVLGGVTLRPEARAFYVAELGDTRSRVSTRFAAAPEVSFAAKSADSGRHNGRFGLGLEAKIRDRARLRVDYDLELGRKSHVHEVTAGVGFEW